MNKLLLRVKYACKMEVYKMNPETSLRRVINFCNDRANEYYNNKEHGYSKKEYEDFKENIAEVEAFLKQAKMWIKKEE